MPHTLEVVRQIPHIMRSTPQFLQKMAAKYGDNVSFNLPDEKARFINHPDLIQHVLQTNYRNYSKQTPQFKTFSLVTGNGLLNSDGAFWLQQRRIAQPAFHQRLLDGMVEIMCQETERLAQRWAMDSRYHQPVQIEQEMLQLTLPIIMRALFSADLGDKTAELVHLTETALEYVMFRAQTVVNLPLTHLLPVHRRFRRAMAELDRFVYDLIARRRANGPTGDLLSLFLAAKDTQTGERLPDEVIRDEVLTLIIAGYETAAAALTWAWYLLSQQPKVMAALREEVDGLNGRLTNGRSANGRSTNGRSANGRSLTAADLQQLPYTQQIIQEVWRLYPSSWLISRTAVADDMLGETPIAAGTYVIICPYTMHRHPDFWPQPEQFDPGRFAPQQRAARHRFAYIPFGGGPRLCIGARFAEMESMVILATLAQRFTLTPTELPRPLARVTIRPHNGMLMQIGPRE